MTSHFDSINKPKHYNSHPSGVECIQITEHLPFCIGNAIKYLWRYQEKLNPTEDLQKAIWYINREIKRIQHHMTPQEHQEMRNCLTPKSSETYRDKGSSDLTEEEIYFINRMLRRARSEDEASDADISSRYKKLVQELKKNPDQIYLSHRDKDVIHMILGLTGEIGELIDALKKNIIYNLPIPFENIREELGDIEFYLEGLRQALGLDRNEILEGNIRKLEVRYSSGSYSDKEAEERADKQ